MARPKKKHPGGRPPKMTKETLQKLEEAFLMGCTDEEACLFAEIATSTLYNYQENNEKFLERKKELKQNPFLKARRALFKDLDNVESAKWFLERKKKKEFGKTLDVTSDGEKLVAGFNYLPPDGKDNTDDNTGA